jgi:hypothetical protein
VGCVSKIFGFPNPVNEKAARTVAAFVAVGSAVVLATGWYWLVVPIAYGFVARVLTGPRLSPLGALAQRVIAPRFLGKPKLVPGPPKRFAQGIGAVVTVTAAVAALALGLHGLANGLLGMMVLFAGLEAVVGFCVGCAIFAQLMRVGLVPQQVCEACKTTSGWSARPPEGRRRPPASGHVVTLFAGPGRGR